MNAALQCEKVRDAHTSLMYALGKVGRADFHFGQDLRGRSCLTKQYVEYPFHITRPHYLETQWQEFATLCLQSVSGGLLQGDRIQLSIKMAEQTAVQFTTQAATKVHSMHSDHAEQRVDIQLGSNSYLEYLCDPMILFPQSSLKTILTVHIAEGAKGIFRDAFLYHDPRGGTEPDFDSYLTEVGFFGEKGHLLALDRQKVNDPQTQNLRRNLSNYPCQGGMFVVGIQEEEQIAEFLHGEIADCDDAYVGVSRLPNEVGLYFRILAHEGSALREINNHLVSILRPALMDKQVQASWQK